MSEPEIGLRSVDILFFSVAWESLLTELSSPQGRNDTISEFKLFELFMKKSGHDVALQFSFPYYKMEIILILKHPFQLSQGEFKCLMHFK